MTFAGKPIVRLSLACLVVALPTAVAAAPQPDPVPIIVTYELRKQRRAARLASRDPKSFWVKQIVARLEEKKPKLPVALKQPVVVRVSFVVAHDGHLVSKTVARSSGNELADKTAMELLGRAQPFPPMPAGLNDDEMTFALPVRFR